MIVLWKRVMVKRRLTWRCLQRVSFFDDVKDHERNVLKLRNVDFIKFLEIDKNNIGN